MRNQEFIFGAMFQYSNKLQNIGDRVFGDISMKQWFLLAAIHAIALEHPGLSEVADFIGYSRQNVKKIALQLESAGLVVLQKDKDDKRFTRISMTPACHQYLKTREPDEERLMKQLFRNFSATELDVLAQLMYKLGDNITTMDAEISK
ncbi:MarR family winged helix-turn-helix transcriptional regulator [Culicoidibacter larvae]|uniref:MarR family transcriptional regulator n=1 Tax=Culicoidibacter larvae TaxID=2579976 RepID=A0A5R8QB23_9FIRM|nr:MarR family transcriptional regulator [Culicoidibacter larvae]TLG72518.1 MarR family transcriptional regulator [Culicoidibacter larvae]